ncbi:gluconate 2-dehydrogenase subunit 3 family protein [Pleomorphovibrio marinus]|uniref:gluconate 2-dehydrogenase subunit 3 family protein n=1 Tax=Pleomorphovibrio marinus TaxID=2164132 RepID=UPI000E0C2F1F|nr:gluconate 2-dehydrogenase subunit 3 family protein [Pleomorphovibrio marinus]
MNRRRALQQLAMVTGGLVLIPSCDFSKEEALKAYQNLGITEADKQVLTSVVNVILPGKNLKGAEEISLQDFVLVMANDCMEEKEQKSFVKGLKELDNYTKKQFGKVFTDMDAPTGADAFRAILAADTATEKTTENIRHFLGTTKKFAIQGYMTSEYFLTEISPYELVPGGFKGKVNIEETEIIKTNG